MPVPETSGAGGGNAGAGARRGLFVRSQCAPVECGSAARAADAGNVRGPAVVPGGDREIDHPIALVVGIHRVDRS